MARISKTGPGIAAAPAPEAKPGVMSRISRAFKGPPGPTRQTGLYQPPIAKPPVSIENLRPPASMDFSRPLETPKPRMSRVQAPIRGVMGVVALVYAVEDGLEIWRLFKEKAEKKAYLAPAGGYIFTALEGISLLIKGWVGTGLSIGAAGGAAGFSWWREDKREDSLVEDLYNALLDKDITRLNQLIDLDHWSGHIVDDDVLTKLIEKVKKYNPEILSRNNKDWADFWKSPEMNHFRTAAVDRLNDLFRPSSDRNAATFFLESGIDFDHLKKEDSSALYELETRWSNRVDQPLQNPYNKEQSGVTLRDLKARVYKLYSENQQTIALSKPADLGTSRLAQPPIESAKVVEDPILKATKDIEKVKQLRKEKNLDEAMRLAQNIIHNLTILPSLPQSNTPEASYLRGTALAYIGTIQYEMAMNEHSTNFEVARRTLNDALQQLRAGQFQKQLPTREIGFVHYNLAKIALASKDESLAVTEYTMAAAEYFMAKKDSRYNSVKKETNINLSNAYYEIGRLTMKSDKGRAKDNFKKSFDCAAEISDEVLKTRAQAGLSLVQ